MNESSQWLERIAAIAIVIALLCWGVWRSLKKSVEPMHLLLRWGVTLGIIVPAYFWILPMVFSGVQIVVAAGVLMVAACAIVIGLIWAPSWGSMLAKPLTSAFDGGDDEPEQTPIYSPAEAKRRRNHFREAIQDIRGQLEKFPRDFQGQFMMAQIQAEDLNDLQGAQVTIDRLVAQAGHAPANVASALHALADWHVKFGQDPSSAREALQRITELLPNTQFAHVASQRLAHLASIEVLIEAHDRRTIELGTYEQFLGLRKETVALQKAAPAPARAAAELVKHLETHPLDTESREELALLYAEQYGRMDLARNELEHLIGLPNQAVKRVVHWLNVLADLQLKYSNDLDGARESLRRIMEKFPKTAYAEQANTRIAYLKLETRKNEKSQAVPLGSYEKYLGLVKEATIEEDSNEKQTPRPGAG